MEHKFPYKWTLKDAQFTKDKGKVFSCFACGGGSTMGYKLAGFDVIGCNEIDPRMNKVYVANHHPRLNYLCDIREMVTKELPAELYNLDVLDGSPPCSSFSSSGRREKDWGKHKVFKEGQVAQVLDTLFFDFIDLAKKLQPKVVIAENVKGLTTGSAKEYVKRIYASFDEAGYSCQHFLLDASQMGVPQKRVRVFFLCLRKDLVPLVGGGNDLFGGLPHIDMAFNEREILFSEISDHKGREITAPRTLECWKAHLHGEINLANASERLYGKRNYFDYILIQEDKVCPTLTIGDHNNQLLDEVPRYISVGERIRASSFPSDFKASEHEIGFCTGMCVPPVMMAQVASRVYDQWLSKL